MKKMCTYALGLVKMESDLMPSLDAASLPFPSDAAV